MHRQQRYQMQSKFLQSPGDKKAQTGRQIRSPHYSSSLCILFHGSSAHTYSPRPYVMFPKIPISYREIADMPSPDSG